MAIGTRELLAALKIDHEFAGKIPPLTEAEFEQLRENILDAGEVYEPIRVWNGTVVDGHNRLKIIRENPNIKWKTRDMEFADKWAAFEWMYKNQLGRRNLTDGQRTYMIGKMYEARKNTQGSNNQYVKAKSEKSQNATLQNGRTPRTDEIIGKEVGVNHATVSRAYEFAKGVDAIREVDSGFADKILAGKANVTKKDVRYIVSKDIGEQPESRKQAAEAVIRGEKPSATTGKKSPDKSEQGLVRIPTSELILTTTADSSTNTQKKQNCGRNEELRELYRTINEAYAPMTDESAQTPFDINDLKSEIDDNGEMFLVALRNTIESRKYLLVDAESKQIVFKAIANIMQGITELRGEYVS